MKKIILVLFPLIVHLALRGQFAGTVVYNFEHIRDTTMPSIIYKEEFHLYFPIKMLPYIKALQS